MPPRIQLRFLGLRPLPRRFMSQDTAAASVTPLINVWETPVATNGHVRVIELNRPAARNALSRDLVTSLRAEIDRVHVQYGPDGEELLQPNSGRGGSIELGPTRAVVLASSSGTAFCAGADLKERRGFTEEEITAFLRHLRDTLSALESLPIPSISAISSLALGGGLELALATDFRVMTPSAKVGLPETRLGIIPGAGGTYRLRRLLGASRALDMILTGRRVGGMEALATGLADRLTEVPKDGSTDADVSERERLAVRDAAVAMAEEICKGGPVAIRAAREAVRMASPQAEERMYKRVLGTEDRLEALSAFAEKREPRFKGR